MNYVGPYEIVRRVHGNIYEIAHEVDGACKNEDATKFVVRSKTALRFDLGQTNARFAQTLHRRGDLAMYCPSNFTWFIVSILADNGEDTIPIHYLNVDPKSHKKAVKDIIVSKRKFQLVWISETVANSEVYADKQPDGYVPFKLSVARRR